MPNNAYNITANINPSMKFLILGKNHGNNHKKNIIPPDYTLSNQHLEWD
jgi:hypothetical protein